jgi:hypothetical protein
MKKQLLFTLTAAFAAGLLPSAFAADTVLTIPGSASFVETGYAAGTAATPAQTDYLRNAAAQSRSMTAWKLSLAPVIASQALDAFSSRGLHEENPLLANSGGQFGAKAALLKAGLAGALLGVEYVVVRAHPGAAKLFWKLNLASAAVTGGVAAHNLSLR